jgi:hypothetical protein
MEAMLMKPPRRSRRARRRGGPPHGGGIGGGRFGGGGFGGGGSRPGAGAGSPDPEFSLRQAVLAIALILCLLLSPIAIFMMKFSLRVAGVDVAADARWCLFLGTALGLPLLFWGQRRFKPASKGAEHNRWLAVRFSGWALIAIAALGLIFLVFTPGD